jgi:hypothetical protein
VDLAEELAIHLEKVSIAVLASGVPLFSLLGVRNAQKEAGCVVAIGKQGLEGYSGVLKSI